MVELYKIIKKNCDWGWALYGTDVRVLSEKPRNGKFSQWSHNKMILKVPRVDRFLEWDCKTEASEWIYRRDIFSVWIGLSYYCY